MFHQTTIEIVIKPLLPQGIKDLKQKQKLRQLIIPHNTFISPEDVDYHVPSDDEEFKTKYSENCDTMRKMMKMNNVSDTRKAEQFLEITKTEIISCEIPPPWDAFDIEEDLKIIKSKKKEKRRHNRMIDIMIVPHNVNENNSNKKNIYEESIFQEKNQKHDLKKKKKLKIKEILKIKNDNEELILEIAIVKNDNTSFRSLK